MRFVLATSFAYRKRLLYDSDILVIFFLSIIFFDKKRRAEKPNFLLSIHLIRPHTTFFISECQNSSVGKEIFFSNSGKTSLFLSLSFSLSNSFSHCPNLSNSYVSIENTRSMWRHMSMIRIKCFTLRSLRTHLVGSRRFRIIRTQITSRINQ